MDPGQHYVIGMYHGVLGSHFLEECHEAYVSRRKLVTTLCHSFRE